MKKNWQGYAAFIKVIFILAIILSVLASLIMGQIALQHNTQGEYCKYVDDIKIANWKSQGEHCRIQLYHLFLTVLLPWALQVFILIFFSIVIGFSCLNIILTWTKALYESQARFRSSQKK